MRVLHLVHQYPPDHLGGTEHYTRTVAQQVADAGHTVGVVTRVSREGQGVERVEEDGVAIYRIWQGTPSAQQRYLANFATGSLVALFEQVIQEFKPDVVHVQHLMGLPAALLTRLHVAQIPYVITLHDYWWVCANAQLLTNYDSTVCGGPRGHLNCTRCAVARGGSGAWLVAPALWGSLRLRDSLLAKGLQRAHALLASTPFVAQWYQSHGAPAAKMQLLPLGVDLPADFAHTHTPGRPLQVAYLGGLAWQKGVHVAVDAFWGLDETAELWIAGAADDPDYEARLRENAGPNVHFLGRLERDAVWALLARVDVVVVPSLWYETYSYLLHEALAAGVPVVASQLGVMAETITDGVNGLLVPPGDSEAWRKALQRLTADCTLVAQLTAQIQRPPSVQQHITALLNVYQSAIQESLTHISPNI
jgi:glycosyltransferase involved in cell wall biosynthesis